MQSLSATTREEINTELCPLIRQRPVDGREVDIFFRTPNIAINVFQNTEHHYTPFSEYGTSLLIFFTIRNIANSSFSEYRTSLIRSITTAHHVLKQQLKSSESVTVYE